MLAVECNVYAFIKACVVYSCKILNPGAPPRWIVPDKIIAHTPQLADARNLSFGTCVQEAQTQDGHSFCREKAALLRNGNAGGCFSSSLCLSNTGIIRIASVFVKNREDVAPRQRNMTLRGDCPLFGSNLSGRLP